MEGMQEIWSDIFAADGGKKIMQVTVKHCLSKRHLDG